MGFRPIALVGLMGGGKSVVAALLGDRLGGRVADLDARIEADAGCSVAEIFAREGEAGFRARESAQLAAILEDPPAVLSCGGGVILDPECRAMLAATCLVVWLEVSPEEAGRRLAGLEASRPMFPGGAAALAGMLRDREPLYAAVAEFRVKTDGLSPEQVADTVLAGLERGRRASA